MARDDFEILDPKPIGTGQFGTVFRARRRSDGRAAALKLILRRGETGAETIAAERHGAILQQGFAALYGMVPEVFEFDADGDDFYIAMELIDGPSLEDRLREERLPHAEAVAHATWLCGFLDKAHTFSLIVEGRAYRLLHNDLKPAHLKLPACGERKVLDFGIAKALEQTRELATDVGRTIAYAAPERLLSERVNVHADFWSLGVMLYEMLSGHRPYPSLEGPRFRRQLYNAITSNAPRAPLPANCPVHLQAIVNRLLAFQPEHRYQSATEIAADLERFTRGEVPLAAAYYETPATMPVSRAGSVALVNGPAGVTALPPIPQVLTPPVPASALPPLPVVPATDPVPAARGALSTPSAIASPPDIVGLTPARVRHAAARRSFARRLLGAAITVGMIVLVATEGVAWLFAEHFRSTISAIDERSVTASREAYDAVEHWALLDIGLRLRVNRPLVRALTAVGDRVVADYRREVPTMGPDEWRQAQAAFAWAREISPHDASLRSKELTAEGHVRRLAAQKTRPPTASVAASQAAVARFRDAAAADPGSFDPYLGMAVTQVYALGDLDGAMDSLEEAKKRGFRPTRRETALLGDAYLRRGQVGRRRALVLSGDERRDALVKAKADFDRCVATFAQVVDFGNAAKHLESCKAQGRQIDQQVAGEEF